MEWQLKYAALKYAAPAGYEFKRRRAWPNRAEYAGAEVRCALHGRSGSFGWLCGGGPNPSNVLLYSIGKCER